MIKRRRGRPKKLDPIRGEDVANGKLVSNVSSVFDDFDNAALDAVSHQDVLGDAVLGSLDDTIVDDVDMHVQNSSGKYVSEFDELPVTRPSPMAQLSVGNQQALLSETVIDIDTLVDTVIMRLAERDNSIAQQPHGDAAVDAGNRLLPERRSSILGTLPRQEQASSSALHQRDRPHHAEQTTCHQDIEYNQLELSRAKTVIAEVMGMHAAVPFNTPVDPIALGIPDYFDIVDTPMDFSTIYSNIEKGLKYKNSKDVLKDVERIWKSCKQYYSKGDDIMDLMELVKKNFIKCWTAAGLHNKIERLGGCFIVPSSVSAANRVVATQAPANTTISDTVHLQPDAFHHQQSLQPHQVYRQSDQPDYGEHQPQLQLPRDNLQIVCTDFSGKKKRTRGPTKCLCVWSRRDDKRISVSINKLGEPTGPKAAKLSNFLGTIARDGNLVPLSYITWKKVPAEVQETIWQLVQSKFVLDPEIRGWVFRNLATKFANWKAHLKAKHYNPHQSDEERLADRDKRVLPDQWQDLINFWNSEESQKQSERNKANRAKVKFCHTSGTKSFARLSEERAVSNGKEPTKAELFILTRTRKDGQPVNESSSMAISQLREKMAQLPETVQSDDCADEILYETIGQNKRNRTRVSRRAITLTVASEIKRAADEEVSQMRQKLELMEQKYKHMETLMNKVLSNIDTSATNEQVGMPLAIEDSSAPGSPADQVPAEEAADMPASSEIHTRKRLKAT